MGVIKTEIVGQLPTDDELLQEGGPGFAPGGPPGHLQGRPLGGELAEVEVRGEVGLAVQGGVVAVLVVAGQFAGDEFLQLGPPGFLAGGEPVHFGDAPVHRQPGQEPVPIRRRRRVGPGRLLGCQGREVLQKLGQQPVQLGP